MSIFYDIQEKWKEKRELWEFNEKIKKRELEKQRLKEKIKKQEIEKQERIKRIAFLEQLLKNPYFQDVIVSELDFYQGNSNKGYVIELTKKDGSIDYLREFSKEYNGENDFVLETEYCNLDLKSAYEAMVLISYGYTHYSYGYQSKEDIGFDKLIKFDEIKQLPDNVLLYYSQSLDCIASGEYSHLFNLMSDSFLADCKKCKQKAEALIKEKGLRKNPSPKKEAGLKGEQEVEYALSWLPEDYIVLEKREGIKFQCELRGNLVQQEIDHIVIGFCGVVLVETKNYSGKISIDVNGNWVRHTSEGQIGEKNPIQQMERHHLVVETILDMDIPIYDVICIANDSSIIEGTENSLVPIVKSDMLAHYIKGLEKTDNIGDERLKNIIKKLEDARV